MVTDKQQEQRIIQEVDKRLDKIRAMPLTVAVVGPTGNGKSSLINALTGANLKTDPVRPCTKEISDPIRLFSQTGHEILFFDLPGIGESSEADERYFDMYVQILKDADIVLWLIHADNRSVTFERRAFEQLIASASSENRLQILNKITLVMSKCDLLANPPWVCGRNGDTCIFAPQKVTSELLDQKSSYFAQTFLKPFADTLQSRTFLDIEWAPAEKSIEVADGEVIFNGFLDDETATRLKAKHPNAIDVIDRLADNHRVIPTSARFRFNLYQLLGVVVNKMGLEAVQRFRSSLYDSNLNQVSFSSALEFSNLVIVDRTRNEVIFDLRKQSF